MTDPTESTASVPSATMTADEVLAVLRDAMGKPLAPLLRRIGIPREKSIGGPVMRKLAEIAGRYGKDLIDGPYYGMSACQLRVLESELGRSVANSGDVLFGNICVYSIDDDEDIDKTREEAGVDLVDIRQEIAQSLLATPPAGPNGVG